MERLWNKVAKVFSGEPHREVTDNSKIEYTVGNEMHISYTLPESPQSLVYRNINCIDVPEEAVLWDVTHFVILDSQINSLPITMTVVATTLTHLLVLKCHLTHLSSAIIKLLVNLKVLDVTGNCLIEIPEAIENLKKLETLYIMSNKLKYLPVSLVRLPLLEHIEIRDNPLLWPPPNVCEQGLESIKLFISEYLEKHSERENVLKNSKLFNTISHQAYGHFLFLNSREVPKLSTIVLNHLVNQEDDSISEEIPPLMRRQLTYANDLGKPTVALLKCSKCKMFFSNEAIFTSHICVDKQLLLKMRREHNHR